MTGLVGRDSEFAKLDALFTRATDGAGGALIVRGEAGIGKSALIEAAQAHARRRGMNILAGRGVASETLLPFGGLHQLLWPLTRAGTLPDGLRQELRAALGQTGVGVPEFYGVALSALDLLVQIAEKAPLLVIAEDAHWFDRSSADLLGFVARRIGTEPIALIAAVRDGATDPFADALLPEVRLGPLPDASARTLLGRAAADLPPELRERLLDSARGNPLALLELPAAARKANDAELSPPTVLPMNERLENAFSTRLKDMPSPTRALLLAAAAEPSCSLGELLAVVATVTGEHATVKALDPAVAAGLVRPQGLRIRFRHPLVASAIYQNATPSDRIATHAALAEALASEPDRAIWHRTAATLGPDPAVVAGLQSFATRAARRGAVSVAIAALEQSVSFTRAGHERVDLLLSAAELASQSGQARERIPDLLQRIGSEPLSARDLARYLQVTAVRSPAQDTSMIPSLVEQAERVWNGDRDLAYSLLHAAAIRCCWGGADDPLRTQVLGVLDRLDPRLDDPRSVLIPAYVSPVDCGSALLHRAEELFLDPVLERRRFGVGIFSLIGEYPRATAELGATISLAHQQGQLLIACRFLLSRAVAAWHTGDWDTVISDAQECKRIGDDIDAPALRLLCRVHQALAHAARGQHDEANQIIAETLADPAVHGNRPVHAHVQKTRGLLALAAGDAADAMEHLLPVFDPAGPHHHYYFQFAVLPDLAEAAAASGQIERAVPTLRALEDRAAMGRPLGGIAHGLAYARAVLAAEDDADLLFEDALAADLAPYPFQRARLNLAYGRHLRRHMRVTESRAPLRLAVELFRQLGAVPWLEQAASELRAAGATAPVPRAAPATLTAQELQIARMAAEGLSNREIGQRLFLSHRTVGSHLYKIFPKLGVTSRSQLAHALDLDR